MESESKDGEDGMRVGLAYNNGDDDELGEDQAFH
jgi:hypothetical protein